MVFRIIALVKGMGWGCVLGALFGFAAHLPADSSRPRRLRARVDYLLRRLHDGMLDRETTSRWYAGHDPARGIFFRPLAAPDAQRVFQVVFGRDGRRLGYGLWINRNLREFVREEEQGGGLLLTRRYRDAGDRVEILERLFAEGRLLRERAWHQSPEAAAFLESVRIFTDDGEYRITSSTAGFFPGSGSLLGTARRRLADEMQIAARHLLPFRMGDAVVYLYRRPGRGQRWLQVHPDEILARLVLEEHLRTGHGEGWFFLGRAEQPLSRRDRYFPLEKDGIKFYFDPNRIFTDNGFRKEFLRVPLFYQYAGYNTSYFFNRHAALFRRALFPLSQVMLALFLTRPEPAIVVHDNKHPMGWSESIFRGHDSTLTDAHHRAPDKRLSDFFLVTERDDFRFFRDRGHNVILQARDIPAGDGSASLAFQQLGKRYICVEVGRDGGFVRGLAMLRIAARTGRPGKE